MRRALLAIAAALVMSAALAAAVPDPAYAGDSAARPSRSLASRVATRHVAGADWRTELSAELGRLPARDAKRQLRDTVSGEVLAGTAQLSPDIDLTGDTTILARRIVLSGRSLRIRANGFRLRLFPVDTLVGGDASVGVNALAAAPITINVSGARGADGGGGGPGLDGSDGLDGFDGLGGIWCQGDPGSDGDPGGDGSEGSAGDDATDGEGAGSFEFDVPDGATDQYRIIAKGGDGGNGGIGGVGGVWPPEERSRVMATRWNSRPAPATSTRSGSTGG